MAGFKDKTVYQIYPKSFCDSNGDGIGDIPGIISKLDYLKDLGIDYIWTTPFFRSPQRDNGYDVSDYMAIEPMFGTMEDVDRLIEEADKRGIGMMFDMVFNHTSTEHAWFRKALAGEEKYQNYYIFREGSPDAPPTNWESKFGGSAWEYVPVLGKWYLHLFDVTQADLNWENPEVREELKQVIRFWKMKGVKGFRFDVVNLISKPENFENDENGDGRRFYTDGRHVHEFLHELVSDTGIADMITVGEMSSTSMDNCIKYSDPDREELSMTFNFHHLKVDYKDGNKWELMAPDYRQLKELFESWQVGMQEGNGWNAVFWDNHDQPRIVSRFGDDAKYWKESAKMLATVIHMMRGTPYVYQGDEIGMTNAGFTDIHEYVDVESLNYYEIMRNNGMSSEEALQVLGERSRDNGRTPMQWTTGKHAGFMAADAESRPWIKVSEYKPEANVEEEQKDADSILQYYKELIALRRKERLISEGRIAFYHPEQDDVLAYERYMSERGEKKYGEKLFVLCNMSGEIRTVDMPEEYREAAILLNNCGNDSVNEKDGKIELQPYECYVLKNR
ncbi:MAG: alpha,alpha-phosphotrehalase [Eubacteriales bacterium]|nr:alpha,alpha-phosphotrehalase [Eubacteriales bacterium]